MRMEELAKAIRWRATELKEKEAEEGRRRQVKIKRLEKWLQRRRLA